MADLTESVRPTRGVAGRPGRAPRPGLVLTVILTGQIMAIIDANIVNVAVPSMHATLGASGASLQLVVAGYTIAYAVMLVTGARLGDILGHRRVFLAGVALFTLASLGCGLAPTTGTLVVLRFIQGVGAATMIPQVLSLIQRSYTSPGPRARAMSMYATVISGGFVVGQVLGGLLVSADLFGSSWRPVFLVHVPVGRAGLPSGRLLPAGRFDGIRTLDLPGLAVLTPAVFALVLPLVLGQPLGWPLWGWLLLALSVALFALLGRVEHRVAARGGQPILPRSLLGLPGMIAGLGGLFASMVVFGGWLFGLALELQDGLGDSPLRAGLTFVPCGIAFAIVSLNWRRLPARYHGRLPMIGFVVTGVGLVWSGLLLHSGQAAGDWLYVALAVTGGGMAGAFGALSRAGALAAGRVVARDLGAFALSSGHAYLTVSVALGVLAIIGAALATMHGRAIAKLSSGSRAHIRWAAPGDKLLP